jgi:hypothetical protein
MNDWASLHNPDRITWNIGKTHWLREVPLAFGLIASSSEDGVYHNVCVRLDGSNPSCGCRAGKDCTIEQHGEETARAFWAAWAREQDGDTLIREGRELAYALTFGALDLWQRHQFDAIGDEVGFRMSFTEAA